MFVEGTLKKASIFLTISVLPFLLGYFLITFFLFSIMAFFMQFFRDPKRKTPHGKDIIVAPADGKILTGKIDRIDNLVYDDPLMDLLLEKNEKGILISTFMSPFDVHVNRVPISGRVINSKYCPGKFKIARKSVLTENEKNLIVIETEYGKVGVIQIAGFVARRIVQYVNIGDYVEIGSKIGMIKFGSRVDLIVPEKNFEVMVKVGDRPKAAETIMGRFIKTD
ncbi:MAG: archaetidylserine decarboxylase [Methanobacteriaceae archaeon]|nr:archaetidylserine decarboxylase [Methanobacteriaceae archaeon]